MTISFLHYSCIAVRSAGVNVQDDHGDTPLHEACICGKLTILKQLLENGADFSIKNADDETSLHTACKEGSVGIVKEILCRSQSRREELLAACDKELNTPLHLAVEGGDLEIVKALLEDHAMPSKSNGVEVVPMHVAAAHGYLDIAKELLKSDNSCKDLLDNQQQSPLHYAAKANQVEMIKFLLSE